MRRWIFQWLWSVIEPELARWLRERVFYLNRERRDELAQRLQVSSDVIEIVENALYEIAIAQLYLIREYR